MQIQAHLRVARSQAGELSTDFSFNQRTERLGICIGFGLGFAEFFGEGFAVIEGYAVETIEDFEIEDEGDEGEGEEDGDHKPRSAEVAGDALDRESDEDIGDEDAKGDEDAELRGLASVGFHEIDFFGGREGTKIADGSVDEGGEEEPADGGECDDQ